MAEPFEEEEFMTEELKAAEQEIYDKVAALRKSMPPLLSFNLAHAGGTIRLETLLDRGWKLQHKSDEQFDNIVILTKDRAEMELGSGAETTYFRWLWDFKTDGDEGRFAALRSDCEMAGIGRARMLRDDMEYLWGHPSPDGFVPDLTEEDRCFRALIRQFSAIKSRRKGSLYRLLAPYVRAVLTADDPEGRELFGRMTDDPALSGCLQIVGLEGWEEGSLALLAPYFMLSGEDLESFQPDYRMWKALFLSARVARCWKLGAIAADRCAELLPSDCDEVLYNFVTPERYKVVASCCRVQAICDQMKNADDPAPMKAAYEEAVKTIEASREKEERRFDEANPEYTYCNAGVKAAFEWQTLSWLGAGIAPLRIIENFPSTVLNGHYPNQLLPIQLPKEGLASVEVYCRLFSGDTDAVGAKLERLCEQCTATFPNSSTRRPALDYLAALHVPFDYTDSFITPDHGANDIEPALVRGLCDEKDGAEDLKTDLFLALDFAPKEGWRERAQVVRLWELNPWHFGEIGEGRFELDNGVNVRAIMPYYQNDSCRICRGIQVDAVMAMYGMSLQKDVSQRTFEGSDGPIVMDAELSYLVNLGPVPRFVTESGYSLRAKVVAAREVTMRGDEGVLCFTLRFQPNVLPHDLDFFINKAHVTGDVPVVGDVVEGGGWLAIDAFGMHEKEDAFIDDHPEGLDIPKEVVPGEMLGDEGTGK